MGLLSPLASPGRHDDPATTGETLHGFDGAAPCSSETTTESLHGFDGAAPCSSRCHDEQTTDAMGLAEIEWVQVEDINRASGLLFSYSAYRLIMKIRGQRGRQVVYRRFTELLALHDAIRSLFREFKGFEVASEALDKRFPRRSYRYDRFNRSFLRGRQVQLHDYLGYLCTHPDSRCRGTLSDFLHGGVHWTASECSVPQAAAFSGARSLVGWSDRRPARVEKIREECPHPPCQGKGTASGIDPSMYDAILTGHAPLACEDVTGSPLDPAEKERHVESSSRDSGVPVSLQVATCHFGDAPSNIVLPLAVDNKDHECPSVTMWSTSSAPVASSSSVSEGATPKPFGFSLRPWAVLRERVDCTQRLVLDRC